MPLEGFDVLDDWRPLTERVWGDLEALFGPRGPVGGCWCMDRRLPRSEYLAGRGEPNRARLRGLASRSPSPGLLGYVRGAPVGWVAVGPRADFPVIDRSVVARRLASRADWTVACLYIRRDDRRTGVGSDLLRAAAAHAAENGATSIEGFAVDPPTGATPDLFAYTGTARQFRRAGFDEVDRPRPARPVMRRGLG